MNYLHWLHQHLLQYLLFHYLKQLLHHLVVDFRLCAFAGEVAERIVEREEFGAGRGLVVSSREAGPAFEELGPGRDEARVLIRAR